MSRSASNNRWGIASRVLAALVGGYAVAYAVTAFLAVYLPLARQIAWCSPVWPASPSGPPW